MTCADFSRISVSTILTCFLGYINITMRFLKLSIAAIAIMSVQQGCGDKEKPKSGDPKALEDKPSTRGSSKKTVSTEGGKAVAG